MQHRQAISREDSIRQMQARFFMLFGNAVTRQLILCGIPDANGEMCAESAKRLFRQARRTDRMYTAIYNITVSPHTEEQKTAHTETIQHTNISVTTNRENISSIVLPSIKNIFTVTTAIRR